MSRKTMLRRLDCLEAKIPKTSLIEDLQRVAGKTKKQANADAILAYRLLIEAADLPADELEFHQRRLAEEAEKFAIRFKDDTSVVIVPEGLPPHIVASSRKGYQRAKH